MLYYKQPIDFNPHFEAVSCIIENYGRLLFLQRNHSNPEYPLTWGVPTGKIEKNESIHDALLREIFEETSLRISQKPNFIQLFYVRYPEYDFLYHLFHIELQGTHEIILTDKEHEDYIWKYPDEALALDLIPDMTECLLHYIKWKNHGR